LPPSLQVIDSDSYLKITPIKSLIGHDNEQFLLLGMLTQIEEGKVYLEDNDAHVELDLSRCVSSSKKM
jgi:DNA polymerase epsilon subunit 2